MGNGGDIIGVGARALDKLGSNAPLPRNPSLRKPPHAARQLMQGQSHAAFKSTATADVKVVEPYFHVKIDRASSQAEKQIAWPSCQPSTPGLATRATIGAILNFPFSFAASPSACKDKRRKASTVSHFWGQGCTGCDHGWNTLSQKLGCVQNLPTATKRPNVPVLFRGVGKQDFPFGCPKPSPVRCKPPPILCRVSRWRRSRRSAVFSPDRELQGPLQSLAKGVLARRNLTISPKLSGLKKTRLSPWQRQPALEADPIEDCVRPLQRGNEHHQATRQVLEPRGSHGRLLPKCTTEIRRSIHVIRHVVES